MNEKILKIPYAAVREDWDFLQKYLKAIGNPKYILVGDVKLTYRKDIPNLGNLVGVVGNLALNWSSIESLGELEFVNGGFSLFDCQNIKTLGNLKKVEGGLNLSDSSIESLGELEYVEGSFNLIGCKKIKTLGKLKRIDGYLDLSYSSIVSLGDLEFVGRNLGIINTNIPTSEINNVNVVGEIINR
jgi:hypothetical protein